MKATNIIDIWNKEQPECLFFSKPDYPFITQVRAEPEYWAKKGWRITKTGRAVEKIKTNNEIHSK